MSALLPHERDSIGQGCLTGRSTLGQEVPPTDGSGAEPVGCLCVLCFSLPELLRSHWYLYWGNIAYKQEAYSLSGENFFMSETENSCSRLCHPFFSRQKIPKSCNQRSVHLIDKVTNKPKCLSTSTAACQTSSIATRCPV